MSHDVSRHFLEDYEIVSDVIGPEQHQDLSSSRFGRRTLLCARLFSTDLIPLCNLRRLWRRGECDRISLCTIYDTLENNLG